MRFLRSLTLALLLATIAPADSRHQVFSDFTTPLPLAPGQTLALGIVGGWERWDHPERLTTRIANLIRAAHQPGTFVETVENHKIELADELIRRAFPDPAQANLIVYGHSLGGGAAIRLCERLQARGINVQLLVIIDAVGKCRYHVPSNVRAAANLYQRSSHWPIVGAKRIRARDPSATRILFNTRFRYSYRFWRGRKITRPAHETGLRWRWMGGHVRMEYDPEVWAQVRDLILANSGSRESLTHARQSTGSNVRYRNRSASYDPARVSAAASHSGRADAPAYRSP
jgi:pimeloyl-ACP methyl ester carboxylesterase